MNRSVYRRFSVGLMLGLVIAMPGCDESTGVDALVAVAVTPADTLIWNGDVVTLEAAAEYESGPAVPDSVEWAVSDSAVLRLSGGNTAQVTATALASGEVEVVATVEGLADTARVKVVTPGDIRWSRTWPDPVYSLVALDGQGRLYFVVDGGEPRLIALDPGGEEIFSVPTCDPGSLVPSVTADGSAYLTGTACSARHKPDGSVAWTQPFGDLDSGVAIDADGSVIVVHSWADIYMSRFSVTGVEIWRDTLAVSPGVDVRAAPAIAANGEIYVPWRSPASTLSRFGPDGTHRWSVPVSGYVIRSSPALVGDRIAVTYNGTPDGLAVYDTSGALIWERTFDGGSYASSPVVDQDGNYYVQTSARLVSYDANGGERWTSDPLGCSRCVPSVGAPTILVGNQLVVGCDSEGTSMAVCSVDTRDGSLIWRSPEIGSTFRGSPAVADDGTVYALGDSSVAAVWNDVPALSAGWPTEGGGMGRLRRQ